MFPTPIYKVKIDPDLYDKQALIDKAMEGYEKQPYRNVWDDKSDLYHTYNNWPTGTRHLMSSNLGGLYQNAINNFMNEWKGKFNYRWKIINLCINTKYMAEHDHFFMHDGWQGMFGTCHYISYDPDQHKPTKFINPLLIGQFLYNTRAVGDALDRSEPMNSAWFPDIDMDVEEDDMIIFPAYLKHIVENGVKPDLTKPRILGVCNIDWKVNWNRN